MYYIYALRDPRNERPFYVGCTNNIKSRYAVHTSNRQGEQTQKESFIREIKDCGLMPEIIVLHSCDTYEEACEKEISAYEAMSYNNALLCENPLRYIYNHNPETKLADTGEGGWLKKALKATGVSVTDASRAIGLDNTRRLHQHMSNKSHLGYAYLRALAIAYPALNMRYILTGEGEPLTHPPTK